jgi:hypothetical protein
MAQPTATPNVHTHTHTHTTHWNAYQYGDGELACESAHELNTPDHESMTGGIAAEEHTEQREDVIHNEEAPPASLSLGAGKQGHA